jgi:hypothetical protein
MYQLLRINAILNVKDFVKAHNIFFPLRRLDQSNVSKALNHTRPTTPNLEFAFEQLRRAKYVNRNDISSSASSPAGSPVQT